MMMGRDAAPAATARAAKGVSKRMPNRNPNAADGTWSISMEAQKSSTLEVQFLPRTNLSHFLHRFFTTARIDEIAELFQLHEVNLRIRFDHVNEIMSVLELVFIASMQTYHCGKLHGEGHLQGGDSKSLPLRRNRVRMFENLPIQLLVRLHHVNSHLACFSISETRDDLMIFCFEVSKRA